MISVNYHQTIDMIQYHGTIYDMLPSHISRMSMLTSYDPLHERRPKLRGASSARHGTWRPRDDPNAIGITSPAGCIHLKDKYAVSVGGWATPLKNRKANWDD